MVVIVESIALVIALIVGVVAVLIDTGPTENVSVFGAHVTGSTSTLIGFGIPIGAMALLGLSLLLVDARRTAARGRDARRHLARSRRETAFVNRDHDAAPRRAPGSRPSH